MNNLFQTFVVSVVLIIIALVFIGISLLITGKQRIKSGTCGRLPKKNRDENCDKMGGCDLCEPKLKEEIPKKNRNDEND